MERITQHLRSTEEHANIRLIVFILQALEHAIPIRASEMRWGPQGRDRIPFGTNIRHIDIRHVVLFDLCSEVDGDLDAVLRVLFFDCVKQGVEPFGRPEISNHPDEIDFGKAGGRGMVEVVHSVPYVLEDRGEGCYANSSADEEDCFVLRVAGEAQVSEWRQNKEQEPLTFKKSSLAEPKGPSIITRGRTRLSGGGTTTAASLPFSALPSKSHPRAFARVLVKSPTIRIWTEM